MSSYKYVFGPLPSRRLGLSLGISPVPEKTCNYSCIYCQLGRTRHLTDKRRLFYDSVDILAEFRRYQQGGANFDVVTVVGEGEPTLYVGMGRLIGGLQALTTKPVAVITNGALLADQTVREELQQADIVLPSFDAADERTFRLINRPHGRIDFAAVYEGLSLFAGQYKGQLWLETMLIKGVNDDRESLLRLKAMLSKVRYDRLYINTPVRPPAESGVEPPDPEALALAVELLGGISIDSLVSEGFYSETPDDTEAALSIIKRHPLNRHELAGFLAARNCKNIDDIIENLARRDNIEIIDYKGYHTFRYK